MQTTGIHWSCCLWQPVLVSLLATVCISLTSLIFNTHSQGSSTQPIWLDDVLCTQSNYSCLRSCQICPSREINNCTHSEDITIECGKLTNNRPVLCMYNSQKMPWYCFLCLQKNSKKRFIHNAYFKPAIVHLNYDHQWDILLAVL